MKKFEELRKIITQHKKELRDRFMVEEIAVFGSYVRRQQKEDSDVDILVEFSKPISLFHIVSLENYLSDILGVKVDIVPKKNIRKELKEMILREAIPL